MNDPVHEKVLQEAEREIGTHEEPMGSNRGSRVQVYQRATWLAGSGWPWCAAFFCWANEKAGIKLAYRGAGAYAWFDWAKQHGFSVLLTKAEPGDGVVFNIGAGHMGIFKELRSHTVVTVDGNWGDRVQQVEHSRSEVRGVVHLPEVHHVPPPKPPVFEIVTSANGHRVIAFTGGKAAVLQWLKKHAIKGKVITIRPARRKKGAK